MTISYRHPIEARMTYGPPRLSLGASILVIAALSVLSWAALLSITWMLWRLL
jgi:hypothetical protein